MFRAFLALLVSAFMLVPPTANAAQTSVCMPTTGTVNGLSLVSAINGAFAALISGNSGVSAPANPCGSAPVKGQVWLDTSTTNHTLKLYDGTNWLGIGVMDPVNHVWMPPVGGGAGTLASAATTDLGSTPEAYVAVTGTTTITSFGTSAAYGTTKTVRFAGALTLTHNTANITLPSSANIVTAVGDTATAVYLGGSTWTVYAYNRASGQPLITPGIGAVGTLASAATTDLGTVPSRNVSITGTTTITSFGSSASTISSQYTLTFTGALTLTHNATSLIIPGAANIVTGAGDTAMVLYLGGGNWRVLSYTVASVNPTNVIPIRSTTSAITAQTNEQGYISPDRLSSAPTATKAWANVNGTTGGIRASYNIASVTRSGAGTYSVVFTTARPSANYVVIGTVGPRSGTYVDVFSPGNLTTTGFDITTARTNDAVGGLFDYTYVMFTVMGD